MRAIKNKQKITAINLFFTFLFSHVKRCYGKLFTVIKEQISHPDLTSTSHSLHKQRNLMETLCRKTELQISFVFSVIFDFHSFNKINSLLLLNMLLHNQSFSKLWIMSLLQQVCNFAKRGCHRANFPEHFFFYKALFYRKHLSRFF